MSSYPPPAAPYSASLSHPEPASASASDNKHDLLGQLQSTSQPYSYDHPASFPNVDNGIGNNAPQNISSVSPQTSNAQSDAQKGNRLRKACDSCSIRKVKVGAAQPSSRQRRA